MTKKCIKCNQRKPLSEFNFKDKAKGRRNGRCRLCTRKDISDAYYKNREYYLSYRTKRNEEQRHQIARFLYHYLSTHPCVDCGLDDPVVLEFDHVYGKKIMAISNMVRRRYPLTRIKLEMKKCQIRCANCHARKTARDFKHYYHIFNLTYRSLAKES